MGAFVPPCTCPTAPLLPLVPLLRLHSARWLPHTSICFLLVFTDSVRVSFYLFIYFFKPRPTGEMLSRDFSELGILLHFGSGWQRNVHIVPLHDRIVLKIGGIYWLCGDV